MSGLHQFDQALARYERAVILDYRAAARLQTSSSAHWQARMRRWNRTTQLAHRLRRDLMLEIIKHVDGFPVQLLHASKLVNP